MIICIKLFIDGSAGIEGLVEFITVCTVKIQIYQSLHILIGEYLILIHNCNEVIQLVRVGFAGQNRRAIIPRERLLNHLRLVCKVQDKSVILFRAAAVKSGKRLHSLDIIEHLIHIHGVEQRLVKARLKHIRNDENAIRVLFEFFRYLSIRKTVQSGRCKRRFLPLVFVLPGKGDNCLVWAVPVRKAFIDGIVILNATGDAGRHNHRTCLPADFPFCNDLLVEVVNHHSRFLGNGVAVAFHKASEFLLRPLFIEHRIVLDGFHQFIETVDGRIVFQHIQNKAFLDGLFHGIDMERSVLDGITILIRNTEGFQCFVFRRSGERKIAGIIQQFASLHHGVDFIFIIHFVIGSKAGERKVHLRRVSAALPGVRLVYDDGKTVILVFSSNLRNDIRKLLNRGDDNALSVRDCFR